MNEQHNTREEAVKQAEKMIGWNGQMIYAERYGKEGEPYIAERGVFLSMEEYVPFREKGWESLPEIDAKADKIIKIRNTPEMVLKYLAPMIRTGEAARDELHRRQQEDK